MNAETLNRARNTALAAILAAGLMLPTTAIAYAADGEESAANDVKDKLNNLFKDEVDDGAPAKSESVYVFARADGSIKNTVVSNWLKNTTGAATIQDVSSLSDIENTDGKETFTAEGENIAWNAEGNDIYYQGNTDKEPPISLRVTYYLDGVETSPEDMAGASGHVKIRFDYTNNSSSVEYVDGTARTVYTPFVCITGMVLDNDVFSNIQAKNAKVMNDGNRTIVGGYAAPGLQEDLGLDDDFDLPAYLEVEADVADFEMGTTATLVSASLLDSLNTDELDTDELGDSLNELSDAMGKLVDGSSQLYEGLNALATGAQALDDGMGALNEGAPALNQGVDALADGSAALADGASGLRDGTSQLAAGAATLSGNTGKLVDGTAQLGTGAGEAANGNSQVIAGLEQLASGLEGASEGITRYTGGITQVEDALTDARGRIGNVDPSSLDELPGLKTEIGEVSSKADATASAANDVERLLSNINTEDLSSELNSAIEGARAKAAIAAESAVAAQDSAAELKDDMESTIPSQDDLTALESGLEQLDDSLSQAIDGLDAVVDGDPEDPQNPGLNGISASLGKAVDSIGTTKDTAQDKTLIGVLNSVTGGINQLKSGADQLNDGAKQLQAGASTLADGADKVDDGAAAVLTGARQVNEGLANLKTSVPTLVAGIQALKEGSAALAQGTDAAAEGGEAFSKGIQTLNSEGVQKMLDAYNDNLAGLSERLKATAQAGKNYDTFTGKSEAMKGTVKFIYETDPIEIPDEDQS